MTIRAPIGPRARRVVHRRRAVRRVADDAVVRLDAAARPRPAHRDVAELHDVVVVDERPAGRLLDRRPDLAADLGQDRHPEVVVLQLDDRPFLVDRRVGVAVEAEVRDRSGRRPGSGWGRRTGRCGRPSGTRAPLRPAGAAPPTAAAATSHAHRRQPQPPSPCRHSASGFYPRANCGRPCNPQFHARLDDPAASRSTHRPDRSPMRRQTGPDHRARAGAGPRGRPAVRQPARAGGARPAVPAVLDPRLGAAHAGLPRGRLCPPSRRRTTGRRGRSGDGDGLPVRHPGLHAGVGRGRHHAAAAAAR